MRYTEHMKKGKVARLLEPKDPAEIAKAIVVHLNTVYRWMRPGIQYLPSRSIVAPLALALGIPEEELRAAILSDRQTRKKAG